MGIGLESWLVWLILAAVLIIVELLTNVIATLCIAVGCVVAMVVSLFGLGIEPQLIGLAAGTVVAFIVLTPVMRKFYRRESGSRWEMVSNMDALVGRVAVLTEEISGDKDTGRVRIDGDNWQVRMVDGTNASVGEKVRVVGNESIVLIVEKVTQ